MGGTIRKIVKNPIKFVKDTVAPIGKKGRSEEFRAAVNRAAQPAPAKPLSAKRGAKAGEMASPVAKASRRRGRRSNVMTSGQGVTGITQTRKKTVLGG